MNMEDELFAPEPTEATLLARLAELYAELNGVREMQQDSTAPMSREGVLPQAAVPPNSDKRRLILVSRQLPCKLALTESGRWQTESTDRSMDQALENFKVVHDRFDCIWVGWPGKDVEPGQQMALRDFLRMRRMVPVFLDPVKEDRFYAGFCKTILWPLFHSAMPTTDDTIARSRDDGDDHNGSEERGGEQLLWKAYRAVNQSYADVAQDVYRDGDLIWVHDYHLLLLPQMLRTLLPAARMAFFLHLPFPSSEIYRILPFRGSVLEGMLSADLIGFQTYDYARHFLSTVESLLDAECSPKHVVYNGHVTNVAICPVGIDPDSFTAMVRSPGVAELISRWGIRFAGKTVLLGVDNVDSTKGLVLKFLAIEELFEREASLAQNIIFVQVCYRGGGNRGVSTLESQLHRIVERINSKLASLAEGGPVEFQQDIDHVKLCALYCMADVLVVTPVRDGMNIVPFEYVVSREAHDKKASVVLSEFAGCARSLGGALLVNPWDTNDVAEKMLLAIRMEADERAMRHSNMVSYVRSFTSKNWCERIVEQLQDANETALRTPARLLPSAHVVQAFTFCRWRLIILNLEGILARPSSLPELVELEPVEVESLRALAAEPYTMVVVKSPRCRKVLQALLGTTNCVLAAEHGTYIRWGRHAHWQAGLNDIDNSWKGDMMRLLAYYTERTPGAVTEEREASLAWHYRDCDLGHGAWQAKQLRAALQEASRRLHVTVYAGDKMLEILPANVKAHVQGFLELVLRRMRQIIKRSRARTTSTAFMEDMSSVDFAYTHQNGAESPSATGDADGWVVRSRNGFTPIADRGAASGDGDGADGGAKNISSGSERFKFHKMVTGVDLGAEFAAGSGRDRVVMLDTPLETGRSRASTLEVTPPRTRQRGTPGSAGRSRSGGGKEDSGGTRPRASSEDLAGRVMAMGKAGLEEGSSRNHSHSHTPAEFAPEGIFALAGAEPLAPLRPPAYSGSAWAEVSDDGSASTDVEEEAEQDVDFVLVMAGGQDLNDEDMFEAMAPPPEYGLEEFLEHVEAMKSESDVVDEALEAPTPLQRGATVGPGSAVSMPPSGSAATAAALGLPYRLPHAQWEYGRAPASPRPSMASRNMGVGLHDPQTITPLMQRVSPGTAAALASGMSAAGGPLSHRSTVQHALPPLQPGPVPQRRSSDTSTMTARKNMGEWPELTKSKSNHSGLGDRAGNGGADLRATSGGGGSGAGGGGGIANVNALAAMISTSMRRQDISTHSKFMPRKDYPPASMLFLAMRRKYGEAFGRHELPDTPAECWALVNSTQESVRASYRPVSDSANSNVTSESGLAGNTVLGGSAGGGGGGQRHSSIGRNSSVGEYSNFSESEMQRLTSGASGRYWHARDALDGVNVWDGGGGDDGDDGMDLPVAIARALSLGALPAGKLLLPPHQEEEDVSSPSLQSLPLPPAVGPQMWTLQKGMRVAPDGGVVEERSRNTSVIDPKGLELPINTFACTVGLKLSQAPYYMKSRSVIAQLLGELARSSRQEHSAPDYEEDIVHVPFAIGDPSPPTHLHSASETDIQRLTVVPSTHGAFAAVNAPLPGLARAGGLNNNSSGGGGLNNNNNNGGGGLSSSSSQRGSSVLERGWSPGHAASSQGRGTARRQRLGGSAGNDGVGGEAAAAVVAPAAVVAAAAGVAGGGGGMMHRHVKSEASLDVMGRPPLPPHR